MYTPPDINLWHGRIDNEADSLRLHQVIHLVDLNSSQTNNMESPDKKAALLGFACDEGVRRNQGRLGARFGPNAAKQKLANYCIHFNPDDIALFDMGNIHCENFDNSKEDPLLNSQNYLSQNIEQLLKKNYFPIVIGGGHELALGHFLGLYQFIPPHSKIGIINFDAHFDLRSTIDGFGNSGTPFWQIAQQIGAENFHYLCLGIQISTNSQALFKTAESLSVQYIEAQDLYYPQPQQFKIMEQFTQSMDYLYLSICLDSFASCYAPGVSAPNCCGLIPQMIFPLLKTIMSDPKLIAFDVAEFCPAYDINEQTAQLAAWLIWLQVHFLITHKHDSLGMKIPS